MLYCHKLENQEWPLSEEWKIEVDAGRRVNIIKSTPGHDSKKSRRTVVERKKDIVMK